MLQDIAGTLATEEADDPAHVSKLRSALESVDHKRRKVASWITALFSFFHLSVAIDRYVKLMGFDN
jgi:hypothetical protein